MPPRKKKYSKKEDEEDMNELGIFRDEDEEKQRDESEDWRDVG